MKIEYVIEEQTGVDITTGLDPSDWTTISVWHVWRFKDGQGWSIGKYRDRQAAEVAKAALEALKEYEY